MLIGWLHKIDLCIFGFPKASERFDIVEGLLVGHYFSLSELFSDEGLGGIILALCINVHI